MHSDRYTRVETSSSKAKTPVEQYAVVKYEKLVKSKTKFTYGDRVEKTYFACQHPKEGQSVTAQQKSCSYKDMYGKVDFIKVSKDRNGDTHTTVHFSKQH